MKPKSLQPIIDQLDQQKVGIFPCDTIWGLIGKMTPEVIQRIARIKQRPEQQPFLILIPGPSFLTDLTQFIPDSAQAYIRQFWPGPLTIIFPKHPDLSTIYTAGLSTIGIRYPLFEPLNFILTQLNSPLISTSVNRSNSISAMRLADIPIDIYNAVDFVYDETAPGLKKESSIIDCTQNPPHILRKGALFS